MTHNRRACGPLPLVRWVHESDCSCRVGIAGFADGRSGTGCYGGRSPGKTGSDQYHEQSHQNRGSGKKSPGQKNATVKKRRPVASKSKSAREVAKTKLPPAKLDLSLPKDMVEDLKPKGTVELPKREAILPQMFGEKDNGFQLNGRLLSNEMELQLRNEARRDVEGAALDFEFKQ